MKKKITAIALVVALLAIAIIGGTLAYFTDTTDEKVNTFTVGKVDIELEETSVADDGVVGEATENGFEYDNIVPGTTYAKKPVITVDEDSLDAYVFAELTISNYAELRAMIDAANLDEYKDTEKGLDGDALNEVFLEGTADGLDTGTIVGSWMDADGVAHLVYSFGVKEAEDSITLFTGVTIPADLDASLAKITKPVDLDVKAYAIQEDNVDDVETAYGEFFSEGWISASSPIVE